MDEVRRHLANECGVERSKGSVKMRASRIRVSLAPQTVCADCGAVGVRVNKLNGLCPRCSMRARVAEEQAFNELLAAEAAGCEEGPELEELTRTYDRIRQQNQRLRKRHGLRGKRERK